MSNSVQKESVLLLGNCRPTLAVSKMLSDKGYRVITGSYPGLYIEFDYWRGQYVNEHWNHPNPVKDTDTFFDALLAYVKSRPDIVAVFPVEEPCARMFAKHPEWAEQLPTIILNSSDVINHCVDKLGLMESARDHGVPLAPFSLAMNRDELLAQGAEIGCPVVLRPGSALVMLCYKKALIVETMEELESLPIDWALHDGSGVIVQKEVKGPRHNVYFTAYDAKMCGCLHSVAFRTSSIDGTGQAVEGISLSTDCPLTEYTRLLIKALDYTGVGCAQFIENGDSGEITFLELNPRLPGNLVFAEYAGLHMSGFLFDLVMNGNPDRTEALCPGGIRYSWVSEDLKTVKTAFTKKEITLGDAVKRVGWVIRSGLRSHIDVLYPGTDCVPGNLALIRQLPGGRFLAKEKGPPPHAAFPL